MRRTQRWRFLALSLPQILGILGLLMLDRSEHELDCLGKSYDKTIQLDAFFILRMSRALDFSFRIQTRLL